MPNRSERRRSTIPFLTAAVAIAAAFVAISTPSAAASLSERTVTQWLSRYEQAWEQRDSSLAAALFTEDATYQEMPFDPPKVGRAGIREYWSEVTADQRDIDFTSNVIAVNGQIGVAHWHATFTLASNGARIELDGIFELTFDEEGSCTVLREWWHSR